MDKGDGVLGVSGDASGDVSGRVIVFDTTLRDGEQSPGCSMDPRQKLRVAHALARLGVDVIEAGFPIASPGDFESVREIARTVEGPAICGLARCQAGDIDRAADAVCDAARPRIHVFLATSAIHREHKLNMARDEIVRRAVEGVKRAKDRCADVEFSPEDAARTEPDFLAQVVEAVIEAGATTVNIPDTVGYTTPREFERVFRMLKSDVRGIEGVVLSVHCHDDLGMAVANSLAAVRGGARQVECTINGIGERAGNAALEEIVMAIHTRGDATLDEGRAWTGVDTTHLYTTSRLVSTITGSLVQRNKAIVGENAFSHEAGIHQHGVLQHRSTYEIMKPEDVGYRATNLVLGKHSGKHAIRNRIEALGYTIDDDQLADVMARFKPLADRKKEIFDADLEALVLGNDPAAEGPWKLVALSTSGGTDHLQTASVELEHVDGHKVAEAAVGDGPVDALFKAIGRASGTAMTIRDFRVHSVSSGEDAQGEAWIDAEFEGRSVRGRGLSTDIVEATALAVIEAVNIWKRTEDRRREMSTETVGAGF
ncbi:MAG: 2-isopropylmalate synthase [Planctomycetota bacterium]